jgi:hypothetical protein
LSGLSNVFLFPVGSDLDELRGLLFGNGQAGWIGFPSLDNTAIAANTLGSGIETFRDLYRGNNGTQGTADQRSAWGVVSKRGRVNLLIQSNDYASATWTKSSGGIGSVPVVTSNFASGPDGTNTASRLQFALNGGTTASDSSEIRQSNSYLNADYAGSFWLKSNTGSNQTVVFFIQNTQVATLTVTSEWQRFTRLRTATVSTSNFGLRIRGTFTGDSADILVWNSQLELGSAATNDQFVTTAFDVTEPGQTNCYYLQPDGVNDGYVTGANLDLSGTDKVTVFAAVRRLSDAARGTVAELTSSIASNDGAFHLTAPNAASATYGFESKGTTLQDAVETSALATAGRIITAVGDISGDLSSIQVDNGTAVTDTSDQGTGNFSNSLLYLFRRGGASLPANLQCFAIIVAGGLYSATTAARVKTILSKYTPGVTL